MSGFFIFLIVLVGIFFALGVRIVPQGEEWVVERLGRFEAVIFPGLNIIVPFVDNVKYKVTTKDIILDIPKQEVITKDNAVILVNAVAFIKVSNIEKAVYGIENFREAMINMVQTSLRSIIGGLNLNQALSARDFIKAELKKAISDDAVGWGLTVKSVEIQDINPSSNMQKSMEMQAGAERERVAQVTKAEADKQAIILNAEARLEAAKRDAEAQEVAAKASAESMKLIGEALAKYPDSSNFLLGDRYITSLNRMANSQNSKVVVLPGDLINAVKNITGQKS